MTTKLILLCVILLCGPALAADPQKASTDTPKAVADGKTDPGLAEWLKAMEAQFSAESGTLITKSFSRDTEGAIQAQTRIDELCGEGLARVTDPGLKAQWLHNRAATRHFVTVFRPGYDLLALEDINKAVELDPTKASFYDTRSKYYCPLLQKCAGEAFQKAVADYEKACTLAPDNYLYPNRLGLLYQRNGFLGKAEYWMRLAVKRAKTPKERQLAQDNLQEILTEAKAVPPAASTATTRSSY